MEERKVKDMLIKCPECELQVSDKAINCPHCGYPLKGSKEQKRRSTPKRMRLPNGFGSITEVRKHNLRNPFLARVSVGKNSKGKPILKPLKPQSYFKTYNEAYEALVEYNKNPYDLDSDISVKELYEKWSSEYFEQISEAGMRTVTSAWAYCSDIYDMRAKDLRARHIKGCMENGYRIEYRGKRKGEKIYATAGTQSRIKSMFNIMLDYAEEYEIVDKNYARTFSISKETAETIEKEKIPHIIFTEEEMQTLWDNVGKVKYVDWVLIQCYMGWRPQELAILRLDEINLDEWYMQAGIKTDAGKQRIIPIHTKIRELIKQNYEFAQSIGSDRLLNAKGQTHSGSWELTYDKYAYRFNEIIKALKLNPNHRPHDPRMTFVTRCKKAHVDEYALKEMVGHTIKDITESTYTVRDVEWLREDLEKMQ